MKLSINDLYFAKCRHCIMDMYLSYYRDGKEIVPRPDYEDYYTVLLFKDGQYVNAFNNKIIYTSASMVKNTKEYYDKDIILEIDKLSNYIPVEREKISHKECQLIEGTITKTKSLKLEYGYLNKSNSPTK